MPTTNRHRILLVGTESACTILEERLGFVRQSIARVDSPNEALLCLRGERFDVIAYCVEHDEAGLIALLRDVQLNKEWVTLPFICFREKSGALPKTVYDALNRVAIIMGASLWLDHADVPLYGSIEDLSLFRGMQSRTDSTESTDPFYERRSVHHARELIDNLRTHIHLRREQIQSLRDQLNSEPSSPTLKANLRLLAREAFKLKRLSDECRAEIQARQQAVEELRSKQVEFGDELLSAAEDSRRRKEDLIKFQESLVSLQEDMRDQSESRQEA